MSNSTTQLDLISSSQAQKEVTANALFDAASPAMTYARRASTSAALTFGYYGGVVSISGTPTQIANGTVSLTASATNYVEADPADGTVSANTTGFTTGRLRLYQVVTGASAVTSYTDLRILGGSAEAPVSSVNGQEGEVVLDAADVGADPAGTAAAAVAGHAGASNPHPEYLTQAEADWLYAPISGSAVKAYIQLACSDEVTALTTGTAKITFRMPHPMTLTAVRASLSTASTSGLVTVNVKESGTSIFSTQLTIDANEKTSTTAATPAVISDAALADDAEITVDIVGAGTGAKGLKLTLIGTRPA